MNNEQYKEFFEKMWLDFTNRNMDFETGLYFEEAGLEAGLLEEVIYNPDIHGEIEDTEEGDTIYLRKDNPCLTD